MGRAPTGRYIIHQHSTAIVNAVHPFRVSAWANGRPPAPICFRVAKNPAEVTKGTVPVSSALAKGGQGAFQVHGTVPGRQTEVRQYLFGRGPARQAEETDLATLQ